MQILYTKTQISTRVKEIAYEISEKYKGEKLTLIGVLRGGAPFLVDLMREIDPDIDVEIDFISVGSYGSGQESSGIVTLHKDTTTDVSGRNVILVDDICDSGHTLAELKKLFAHRGGKSCEAAVMLSKPARRKVAVEAEYIGFEVPDVFVIGYGMDDNDKFRNLKDICVM